MLLSLSKILAERSTSPEPKHPIQELVLNKTPKFSVNANDLQETESNFSTIKFNNSLIFEFLSKKKSCLDVQNSLSQSN